MSDAEIVPRLRLWRRAIQAGRVYDAIDWLAQTECFWGAGFAVKSFRHNVLIGRCQSMLWGETKALVASMLREATA